MSTSTLAQVAAKVRDALGSCARARHALQDATGPLEEAARCLGEVLHGVGSWEAAQIQEMLSSAVKKVAETYRALAAAENHTRAFLAILDMGTSDDTTTNPSLPSTLQTLVGSTSSPSIQPTPERIEELRSELPQPVVRGSGQKTHGRWITPENTAQPLISGRDDLSNQVNDVLKSQGCPHLPARAADDVELKLAALMREKGPADPRIRHVTVVINNRPCLRHEVACVKWISRIGGPMTSET